jgi:sigma-B regulation protein RsbU (phosphoserine phosphatase)
MEEIAPEDHKLRSALALHKDMLPSEERIDQIQAHCPLDVSSYYRARDGIGGDIWGIEAVGPQRVMIYVADFAGHGIPAALNAARFHSFVHVDRHRMDKPSSLLRRLNERLHEVLPVDEFATMFCATIDFKTQTMEYASAGAPPPLYRGSRDGPFKILSQPSLPLGITTNAPYTSETVPFKAGGALVVYSDGLIETPRPPRSRLTTESLGGFLDRTKQASSFELCRNITRELFPDSAMDSDDDITLAVAQHTDRELGDVVEYEI